MRRTAKVAVRVPESGVLRACLDLLAAEKIWHRRWNSGGMRWGNNRLMRFGVKGDADIVFTFTRLHPYCAECEGPNRKLWVCWLECKSDSGKQTEEQKKFESEVRRQGHHYLLVRDVDMLRDWLKEHGVTR